MSTQVGDVDAQALMAPQAGAEAPPERSRRAADRRARLWRDLPIYAPVILFVLVFGYFSITIGSRFYSGDNLSNILGQSSILGVVACGLTVPLVLNTFDLSIGWHASFAGVLGATLAIKYGTVPGIAATLAIGASIGVANGFVVARLRVSSMIATLGAGAVLVGLATMVSSSPVYGVPDSYVWLGQHRVAGIPVAALIMIGLAGVLWVWTNQTPFGRAMYAIGGSREASRLAGLSISKTVIVSLAVSGLFASLAGVMLSSTLGAGQAGQGDNLLLDAFTAAAIGTVTFRRGQYNIAGTMVAVFLLTMMINGMTITGWPDYWQNIVKGVILVGAVAMSKGVSEDT